MQLLKLLVNILVYSSPLVLLLTGHLTMVTVLLAVALVIPLNAFAFSTVYHKLFAHRAFKPRVWVPYLGSAIGLLLFLPAPKTFVALHRLHHKYSDTELDPHTPIFGKRYTFFPAFFVNNKLKKAPPHIRKNITKDLERDYPFINYLTNQSTLLLFLCFNIILCFYNFDIFTLSMTMAFININLHGYANTFFHKPMPDRTAEIVNIPWGARFISPEFNHATHHDKASSSDFGNDDAKDWMEPIIRKFLSK